MAAPTLRGRFVWHELNTTDPDAAARFYPGITGWKVEPFEHDPTYRLWVTDGVGMGGLTRLPAEARRMGAPPHWLIYIGVPDVDTALRQANSLGARTYVAPLDIPVGRLAVLGDPQGVVFALFKPQPGPARSDDAVVGDFSWHELTTPDPKAAWDFYRALFGWEERGSFDMGPAGPYAMFGHAGSTKARGGMYRKPPDVPARWLSYVRVPSVDTAAAAVKRLGGRVVSGPMDVPGGDRIAMCVDPQGVAFAVHAVAAQPTAQRQPAKPKAKRAKAKPKAAAKGKAKRAKRPARKRRR
jgi:predicted enzyme related to lactoylglutathione lyase